MLTLSVGFVIYKCSTSVPSMCCPEVGGLFLICGEVSGDDRRLFCGVFSMLKDGWGPPFVI